MPFVRSERGTRTRFSPARVAATVSAAYLRVHGAGQAARWRAQVLEHTNAILQALKSELGEEEGTEWPRPRIAQAIAAELRGRATMEVQEAHLEQHPPETRNPQNSPEIDPVWSVQRSPDAHARPVTSLINPLNGLGETIRRVQQRRKPAAEAGDPPPPPPRRSTWIAFWHALSRRAVHALDWSAFVRLVEAEPAELRHQTSAQWWRTWQVLLDKAVRDEPRLYALWAAAELRRSRATLVGHDWLDGSDLAAHSRECPLAGRPGAENTPECERVYRLLAREHFARLLEQGKLDPRVTERLDVDALCTELQPDRDRLLDWRGWQQLAAHGCLWAVSEAPWSRNGWKPGPGARELPQWAFLRLSMALALDEPEPMVWARRFYDHLSQLQVVASETLLREAGVPGARYLEDQAARVPDRFEAIHAAMYRAAVGTKWTGTVTLDWRAVRAKGALVAGRRRTRGVSGFLRSIDMNLRAQGRQPGDRPVTVVLPLWHLEALDFIELSGAHTPQIQTVVAVPDEFMRRLRSGEPWWLFDPDVFPELLANPQTGYTEAEQQVTERLISHPASARRMAPARLWRKVLQAARQGNPFVLFEDAQRPFTPFPQSGPPVAGIDGVGSLPGLPEESADRFRSVAWPSAVVNLAFAVSEDGVPQLERLKASTAAAARLLDNAITASRPEPDEATHLFRPVCLGTVGLYEAIEHASAQAKHDPHLVDAWVSGLAEAWAAAAMQADQDLARERGSAPAWTRFADGVPFDPIGGLARLSQQRNGARPFSLNPRQNWAETAKTVQRNGGHRCSVRTVWAPFLGAAAIAGATPGGIGTLQPFDRVVDEEGRIRLVPTPFLMHHVHQDPDHIRQWRTVLRAPEQTDRWPDVLLRLVRPDREQWERRLQHAALIRPWIDQGVSVTLPGGLSEDLLDSLLQRAWWLGLNSIRFANSAASPTPEAIDVDRNGAEQ